VPRPAAATFVLEGIDETETMSRKLQTGCDRTL
jgi:hypothetical protein